MSKATCTISEDGKTITCHRCGRTSHNPNDVAFHYCNHCNHWHDGVDNNLLNAGGEAAVMNKTATICKFLALTMPSIRFFVITMQPVAEEQKGQGAFAGVTMAGNLDGEMLEKIFRAYLEKREAKELQGVIIKTE